MSKLTQDVRAEPVSRDQILRHARGQGNIHFPCSADHEQDWLPHPVHPYSAMCDEHTYIHTCGQHIKKMLSWVRMYVCPAVFRTIHSSQVNFQEKDVLVTLNDVTVVAKRYVPCKRYTRELYDRPKASLPPLKVRMATWTPLRPTATSSVHYPTGCCFES